MTDKIQEVFATEAQITAAKTFQTRQEKINLLAKLIEIEKENIALKMSISERKIQDLEFESKKLLEENEALIKESGLAVGDNISENADGKWVITKTLENSRSS